ncbi:Cmx/CmrA family chloramphenicol efflux MFS transporter [Streptomyces sp. WMMB303]|uniref:Cmx/CmrA family chloramphenicol efflux MFS transporter n=1 Tax=Streptomyces sp. WMMB303 TaxID=3034154 RepID=UPI0023EC3359|nr:Cmx/CmrA family chloramphenicol efflux MFS transporter [Streptomyces sp. WMMB303]MDF4250026.1 MFS transporter [Streptomyces sp. WMMB303]
MPFVLYVLALAVFAQGMSEFMLSGIVPDIAAGMGVSLAAAGSLTSAFAVGMVVGAPLMAALGSRWDRRGALLCFLSVFLLAHVVGASTTSFAVLVATRVVGALANAGFLAVALAAAAAMVPPDAKGRAVSVLLGGVTLACVAGVPAGALLGQAWGWRTAFWAVAVLSTPALAALVRSLPGARPDPPRPAHPAAAPNTGVRRELRALREPRLLVTLLLGALVNGATFCSFTYLAPLLTEVAGFADGWVPGLLALFGLGSFLGTAAAGRLADRYPLRLLVAAGAALSLGWALFGLTAGHPYAAVVLVPVQGVLSFAVGSTLISQALYAAAEAPSLAGGFATAALNVGAALGPWAGGLALSSGSGYRGPLWISALLVLLAWAVGGAAQAVATRGAIRRRRAAAAVTAGTPPASGAPRTPHH